MITTCVLFGRTTRIVQSIIIISTMLPPTVILSSTTREINFDKHDYTVVMAVRVIAQEQQAELQLKLDHIESQLEQVLLFNNDLDLDRVVTPYYF